MRRRHSLRFRVALAFAALGATLGLLFAVGIWFATHDVSQRLMDETLAAELADYMTRRARNPQSLPPATANLSGYLIRPGESAADLPADLAGLPPGRHEITIGSTAYRVAVADREGERFILLFNETRQQRRERRFLAWLIGGAILMTLLSALGGHWLAGLGIAPVTELANAVSRADPENPPRLARSAGPGDEIDELTQAFDRYLARLAAFIERERNFAADASHELRTPLAAIRGAAEVLADGSGLDEAQSARIGRILRATEEMGELIAALLLLSREEAAPVESPCDAGRIARECIERYRGQAAKQDTHLTLEADEVLLPVPAAYFAIIVANLVHNAVAHTRNGTVTIRLDPRQLVVADTGSGIPAADLAHVFERHFRGNESTGAGIGLSLVRRICERLDWHVSLSSHPVAGTTVSVQFAS
ncbi:MAG: HAMP domain-containing sensor histidine kinase [Rhodocyclaceae bacterium]|jgi:signal transduction histidine kinase|nr:HAMP domain-containing sensor histidine kinase [Rhodocyclaceae bacterium]